MALTDNGLHELANDLLGRVRFIALVDADGNPVSERFSVVPHIEGATARFTGAPDYVDVEPGTYAGLHIACYDAEGELVAAPVASAPTVIVDATTKLSLPDSVSLSST